MALHLRTLVCLGVAILAAPAAAPSEDSGSSLIPAVIAQLIIDHASLQPYLHPELPGRKPLVVSQRLLPLGVSLTKFGEPVVVRPDSRRTDGAFLRFEGFSDLSDVAVIRLAYPIEGLQGRFILTRSGTEPWVVRTADVWEQ